MAQTIPLPASVSTKHIGLEKWMDRVLKRAQRVRRTWNAGDIHDLRVALRRCRTMADVLTEASPSPGWNKLKKSSKKLFHTLGALRDVQVEAAWARKLSGADDPIRPQILAILRAQEKERAQAARKSLDAFDRKDWRKLLRKLPAKANIFPVESVVFQRLALAELNAADSLFQKARKAPSAIAWHRVRIAIKRFRYIVENFLPQHYESWGADLQEMQDLLGDVHDLDVLRTAIRRRSRELDHQALPNWLEKIRVTRAVRLERFLSKTSGKESLWLDWRSGLQGGNTLRPALYNETRTLYSAS